jgi:hypothetical protein
MAMVGGAGNEVPSAPESGNGGGDIAGAIQAFLATLESGYDQPHQIAAFAQNGGNKAVLQELSPQDFGAIVGTVRLEGDRENTAVVLAKAMPPGALRCGHVVAALPHLRGVEDVGCRNTREIFMGKAVPLCMDFPENASTITGALIQEERVIFESAHVTGDGEF